MRRLSWTIGIYSLFFLLFFSTLGAPRLEASDTEASPEKTSQPQTDEPCLEIIGKDVKITLPRDMPSIAKTFICTTLYYINIFALNPTTTPKKESLDET